MQTNEKDGNIQDSLDSLSIVDNSDFDTLQSPPPSRLSKRKVEEQPEFDNDETRIDEITQSQDDEFEYHKKIKAQDIFKTPNSNKPSKVLNLILLVYY